MLADAQGCADITATSALSARPSLRPTQGPTSLGRARTNLRSPQYQTLIASVVVQLETTLSLSSLAPSLAQRHGRNRKSRSGLRDRQCLETPAIWPQCKLGFSQYQTLIASADVRRQSSVARCNPESTPSNRYFTMQSAAPTVACCNPEKARPEIDTSQCNPLLHASGCCS